MVTLTKHVILGPDLHCVGPMALSGFLHHLPAKYKWRPKKFYYLSVETCHCATWQIRRWLLHYIHKNFRWGPAIATFRTKTLDFILVIRLNWSEKNQFKGVHLAPWSSILFIVKYCCARVLLYAKMLKETENEEITFFVNFLSLVAFRLRGPRPSIEINQNPNQLSKWIKPPINQALNQTP